LILVPGDEIDEADVRRHLGSGPRPADEEEFLAAPTFAEFKRAAERVYLLRKLREHRWNVAETARALRMPRSNLYKKIERYQLAREERSG